MRKTKIICTMGPACDSIDILKDLIRAGMNVARLNMAHGDLAEHAGRIRKIRQAGQEKGQYVPIMLDIKGPEVRIGPLKKTAVVLESGAEFVLTTKEMLGDEHCVSVNYTELPQVVDPGAIILIDDGLIELTVMDVEAERVKCKVVTGGVLKGRKGVNLPGIRTNLPGVTAKDVEHIQFGLSNKIDYIAASFVRQAKDIVEIRRILEESGAPHVQIIAKIENEEGVERIDEIIEAADGVMVARGDLGVEVPIEEVPFVQQDLIERCRLAGKPVIVATHMLESMQTNPRPTRAEVTDVANAVLQMADVIMLSGETAAGKYPVESVEAMASIAERTEQTLDSIDKEYGNWSAYSSYKQTSSITEMVCQAAVITSLNLQAQAIITPTESGYTARMVAKFRPKAPIVAVTEHNHVLAGLCLQWGVIPVKGEHVKTTDEMFQNAVDLAIEAGIIRKGDYAVIAAGVPIGQTGSTNLVKIVEI